MNRKKTIKELIALYDKLEKMEGELKVAGKSSLNIYDFEYLVIAELSKMNDRKGKELSADEVLSLQGLYSTVAMFFDLLKIRNLI